MSENPIIWQPSSERLERSAMYRFMRACNFENYHDLYRWSITDIEDFWQALCKYCDVNFERKADDVLEQPGDMTTASWFPVYFPVEKTSTIKYS